MNRTWAAIVNPASGSRRLADPELSRLVRRLEEVACPVVTTEYQGHAQHLAAGFERADGVIVAGGDGTLFDVLQTLRRDRQQVVLVPTGRGNSLARDLGLPLRESAILASMPGRPVAIDLLAVSLEFEDGRRWQGVAASTVALGYPARVCRLAEDCRRWTGRHGYTLTAPAVRPSAMAWRASFDGEPAASSAGTGVIISNTRHLGPFEGFPEARLADGLCEVMALRAGWWAQNLHNVSVLTRWHGFRPVRVWRARTVVVDVALPLLVMIDGELRPGVRRVAVTVLPAALTCRVPGGSHE